MSDKTTLETLVMLSDGQARPLIQVLEGMGAKRFEDWRNGIGEWLGPPGCSYLVLPLPTSQEGQEL